MKYEELMISLKQGKYAPAYMLCGKEPYYIDKVADYIEQHVLDEMAREGKLKRGDKILMSAFGAGFTTGACILEWTK